MGTATEYRVVRPHEGDKPYAVGDTRTMDSDDAAHLVPLTLQPIATDQPAAKKRKARNTR